MNKGFIWSAYGHDHKPLKGYKKLYAITIKDAVERFAHEYGKDTSISYLVGDTYCQWSDISNITYKFTKRRYDRISGQKGSK
jgi:rRNA processing protein Krr1/Pno1